MDCLLHLLQWFGHRFPAFIIGQNRPSLKRVRHLSGIKLVAWYRLILLPLISQNRFAGVTDVRNDPEHRSLNFGNTLGSNTCQSVLGLVAYQSQPLVNDAVKLGYGGIALLLGGNGNGVLISADSGNIPNPSDNKTNEKSRENSPKVGLCT